MKLLGWDTSSKTGAIVALEWPETGLRSGSGVMLQEKERAEWPGVRLVAEWSLGVDTRHSERLLWAIHQVLESARWKLEEVDLLAVGTGPGSFTGLRIGITTARTLAQAMSKPVLGVSSLAALARPLALSRVEQGRPEALVLACTDASKGGLFAVWGKARDVAASAVYPGEDGSGGLWTAGVEERAVAPGALMEAILEASRQGWTAVGEGRLRYAEAWAKLPADREQPFTLGFADRVQGRYLGMLAFEAWKAGLERPALEVLPRYTRAADAEVKLRSGALAPAPLEPPPGALPDDGRDGQKD